MAVRSARGEAVCGGEGGHVLQHAQAPGGVAGAQAGIEGGVAGFHGLAGAAKRAVEDERIAGSEHGGGAGEEAARGVRRRDVDHVDAEHGVGARDRPGRLRCVQRQGGTDVGQRACPGVDAGAVCRLGVGRLPLQAGEGGGEEGGVLTRSARDFQHGAGGWEVAAEGLQDGFAVAGGSGRG